MKYFAKKHQILFCLLIFAALASCSSGITPEEKEKLLKQANNGDAAAQYRIAATGSSNFSRNVFDEETRNINLQKALDNGYEAAMQKMIREAQKKKDRQETVKWLNFAVEKGSGAAMHQLAMMNLKGEHVKKDTTRAKALLQSAIGKGFTQARTDLRKLNNEKVGAQTVLIEVMGDRWKTQKGTPLAKLVEVWSPRTIIYLLEAGFFSVRLFGMPLWITIVVSMLLMIAFPVLFFVGYSKFGKLETQYYSWKLKISILPLFCVVWGIWGASISSSDLGSFFSMEDGFVPTVTVLMSYIFFFMLVYAIIMIIKTSPSIAVMTRRTLLLLLLCVYGFLVGVECVYIMLIVIVIWFIKGGILSLSPGGGPSDEYLPRVALGSHNRCDNCRYYVSDELFTKCSRSSRATNADSCCDYFARSL